jgi:hypothetical protein
LAQPSRHTNRHTNTQSIRKHAGGARLFERALAINEKARGQAHKDTNRTRSHLARLLLMSGHPTEALALGETAFAAHDKVLGRDHAWTKDSARVTADALEALGRTEEAKALRAGTVWGHGA